MKTDYTQEDLDDFEAYEKVRRSGKYNMYSPDAKLATGLTDERFMFVLKHYSALRKAFEASK